MESNRINRRYAVITVTVFAACILLFLHLNGYLEEEFYYYDLNTQTTSVNGRRLTEQAGFDPSMKLQLWNQFLDKNIKTNPQPVPGKYDPVQFESDRDWCYYMKGKYKVVPKRSFGSMPKLHRAQWLVKKCADYFLPQITTPKSAPKSAPSSLIKDRRRRPTEPKEEEDEESEPQEQALDSMESPILPSNAEQWCDEQKEKYNVIVQKTLGSMPDSTRKTWRKLDCGQYYIRKAIWKKPFSSCPVSNYNESVKQKSELPLIAIMAATTTRNVKSPSTNSLSLFTLMLPSLIRTLDCGYRYVYVMGYDRGDQFYDSERGLKAVESWFQGHVEQPLKANNIMMTLLPVKVDNKVKKPGPVFLEMAKAAYNAGADFFYRINDDTEFLARWAHIYAQALLKLGPPYGVVGPSSVNTADRILTHDFVHRTHMEIFEMKYYPEELTDWWMDDWITHVYGFYRTYLSKKIPVHHHTNAHGQRYKVDKAHEKLVEPLIQEGREKIKKWMTESNLPLSDFSTIAPHKYNAKKKATLRDIPVDILRSSMITDNKKLLPIGDVGSLNKAMEYAKE